MQNAEQKIRFLVKNSFPGAGKGLFAAVSINVGDFILEYTGRRIMASVADTLPSRYLFEIDNTWTIDAEAPSNLARYINHACDPNCEGNIRDGHILIFASRDIERDEEVTMNYGNEYFDEFIRPVGCRCRACVRAVH